MSLLTVNDLAISFLGRTLFEEVGFQIAAGDRVGLVGPNGAGKTTMLRVLVGELAADKGEVVLPKGRTLGYLPQDLQETLEGQVRDAVLHAVPGRRPLEEALEAVEARLDASTDEAEQNELGTKLGELHGEMAALDTRHPPHEADRILAGLGFSPEDLERPISELSGGWRMRAALAGLLYRSPDLLLMDEPTNHLDLPSVRWLEEFLAGFPGAVVMISHDRDFLDRQVNRILAFDPEGVRAYTGNYGDYLRTRDEERGYLEARARKQEAKVKDAKKFIDRFRAKASKARQAQSKIKLLEKIEMVETHQERRQVQFRFPPVERAGRMVMTTRGLTKSFGDEPVLKDLDVAVERGDRIGVIGAIGAGKTTLLRLLSGDLPPDAGTANPGHGVDLAYYAQHQTEHLDPVRTVVDEVVQARPGLSQTEVRGICGAFLFTGDDVDKTISVLSGGERARVALAKLLVSRANLMIMDEPTNHLDLSSTERLVEALKDYDGTLVFVSHNQGFLSRLATKIWDLRGGTLTEYPGGLYEYLEFLERQGAAEREGSGRRGATGRAKKPAKAAPKAAEATPEVDGKARRQQRAQLKKKLAPLERRVRDLEKRVEKLEAREAELSSELADPALYSDKAKSVPLLEEHGSVRRKLEELMGRWEHATEELEARRAELEGA